MKVRIDGELCTGVALCEKSCPEVFVMADDGIAHVVSQSGEAMPNRVAVEFSDDYLEDVVEAAENCPEECIYIEP